MSARPRFLVPILLSALLVSGCSSTYYRALESVGIEKRDILADRVDDARDSQVAAKEQFQSALDQYRSVVAVDGGDLEEIYDRLNAEYRKSERRARAVSERIDSVRAVASDLFEEWEQEIDEYRNPDLGRQSRSLLSDTRADYERLIRAMDRAEESMQPVLILFNDRVMFLRHNLNARAISALETELQGIETATSVLIDDMQRAIDEAARFIDDIS